LWRSAPRRSRRLVIKVSEDADVVDGSAGIESMGIYRLSGTTSRVQALKAALDKGKYSDSCDAFL